MNHNENVTGGRSSQRKDKKAAGEFELIKAIQIFGLLLAVAGLLSGYLIASDFSSAGGTPTTSTGAGLLFGLMLFPIPCILISAFLLLPTSISLLFPRVRLGCGYDTKPWKALLGFNLVICSGYLYFILAVVYQFVRN